jgi:hypothetical protein
MLLSEFSPPLFLKTYPRKIFINIIILYPFRSFQLDVFQGIYSLKMCIYYYLPHLNVACVTPFDNIMGVCGGIFCMCLGFHCPIFDSVKCENGVTFQVVSYVLLLDFLSEATNLVRVTGSQMLQRQKHNQVLVTCLLFANVAKTEMWSEFYNVHIVRKCCRITDYYYVIIFMVIVCFMNFCIICY